MGNSTVVWSRTGMNDRLVLPATTVPGPKATYAGWERGSSGSQRHPLPAMCATLGVSLSGYQAWKRGDTPNRKPLTAAQLLVLIEPSMPSSKMLTAAREWPRRFVVAALRRARSVERLMRENGITRRGKASSIATRMSRSMAPATKREQKRLLTLSNTSSRSKTAGAGIPRSAMPRRNSS